MKKIVIKLDVEKLYKIQQILELVSCINNIYLQSSANVCVNVQGVPQNMTLGK